MHEHEGNCSSQSSETLSCRSFQSDFGRTDNTTQSSLLNLCMNIERHQQRKANSEPIQKIKSSRHKPDPECHQTTIRCEPFQLLTPPGTPQKDGRYLPNSEKRSPHAGQYLSSPSPKKPQGPLSPLMVDTGDAWSSSEPHVNGGKNMNEQRPTSYHFVDNLPLNSTGIFLPVDRNLDARKRDKILNAIANVMKEDDDRPVETSHQKFALQDPAQFRFKRQSSTESNESGDIRYLNKSPVKKIQPTKRENESTVQASSIKQQSLSSKSLPEISREEIVKCKPYATNLQWITTPEPKSEEDFFPANHSHRSEDFKTGMFMDSTSEFNRRESTASLSTHNEMMTGFNGRTGDRLGTGTTVSSRNQTVGENGFLFPKSANVTEPFPFSPRIISTNTKLRPVFPESNVQRPSKTLDNNIDKFGSIGSLSCDNQSGSHGLTSVSNNSNIEKLMMLEFFRKRALRSNSDIPTSPSKHEIEQVREFIRNFHRSLSDPSSISPRKKAMLYEERMVGDLFSMTDDVFEEQVVSTPNYSDSTQRSCNTQIGQFSEDMIIELLGQNEKMKRELTKRQLFKEHQEIRKDEEEEEKFFQDQHTRPSEIASLLLGGIQRTSTDKIRRTATSEDMQAMDRVDGSSNKTGSITRQKPDTHTESDSVFQPPRSPIPSTSMMTSPLTHRLVGEAGRKRKHGEITMRLTCEDLLGKSKELTERLHELDHVAGKNCKCANIENEILLMANDAYAKIRRVDDSKQALQQYQEEVNETNRTIFDSMTILCSIKSLCKHGRTIEDIYPGSVVFVIGCHSTQALDDLWMMYKSGTIEREMNEDFLSPATKQKYDAYNLCLKVHMKCEEYLRVRKELDDSESIVTLDSSFSKSDTEIARVGSASKENIYKRSPFKRPSISSISIVHMRSQSAPHVNQPPVSPNHSRRLKSPQSPLNRDRKFSFSVPSDEHSPRRVFQELNFGSPTLKKVFDFDIALTSKTSPKRKSFAEPPPWEQDNQNMYHDELNSPKRKNFGSLRDLNI